MTPSLTPSLTPAMTLAMTRYFLLFTCFILFSGCASLMNKWGEPAASKDATPPPGYAPIFLTSVSPLPTEMPPKTALQITSVDTRQPGKTRAFVHLADSSGTYYRSASAKQLKSLICEVVDVYNGVETPITNFTITERSETDADPLALAWVVDNSGSMGDARARAVQKAIVDFTPNKGSGDAFVGVRYDNKVVVEIPATTSTSTFSSGLKQDGLTGFGGGTAIIDATITGIDQLAQHASKYEDRAVVVFTDGRENSSVQKKEDLVQKALASKIPVVAVDFGANVNKGYMQDIATSTGGFYQHIYKTEEFSLLFGDIYRRLRNSYVIEYPSTKFGDHEVRITFCVGNEKVSDTTFYNNTPMVGAVALININFDVAKATIRKESQEEINNVASIMQAYPNMTIELRGHTDSTNSTGDPNYNVTLSQNRADAVRDALVKLGIATTRITSKGFGDSMPVATNTTDVGRQRNRRTEFVILTR